jgi:polar amino acid transport system ATP-binding protein
VILTVQNLKKTYPGAVPVEVLRGVSLDFKKGELFALIGRSGCGKSTLLRCMNGLEFFDRGSVCLGDRRIRGAAESGMSYREFESVARAVRLRVGMVFQGFHLFPHRTLLQNVATAPQVVLGHGRLQSEAQALELLDRVGLKGLESRYPAQLSGGQQQRGAIARALALKPEILLYDEPTSALDPELREEVLSVMRSLKSEGMTQVVVTHEMRFAREVGDRAAFLDEGSVLECREARALFDDPQETRLRAFLKKSFS